MPEDLTYGAGEHAWDIASHLRSFAKLDGKTFVTLMGEAGSAWVDDKAPRLSAALAFYTLLSIAPLLVVAIAIAALAFGKAAVEGQLFWQTRNLLGEAGAKAVQDLIQDANHPGTGLFATVIGVVTLLFGASSVVVELVDALNTIWGVAAPASTKWASAMSLVKERAYAFLLIIGTGIILLTSLMVTTLISALEKFFSRLLPVPGIALRLVEFGLAYLTTTMLFAAIYKFMPAVRLKWSDVFVGACVTSLLFAIGRQLVGIYLGKVGLGSSYGAAGSVVTILVWTYYSAQIFFLGAEFTKVYTRKFGSLQKKE
jgi:membrane protein